MSNVSALRWWRVTSTWEFTSTINWTGQTSRMPCARRAKVASTCWGEVLWRTLLRTFYDTVVVSAIFYTAVCWGSGSMDRDRKRLNKLIKRNSSILDCPLDVREEDFGQTDVNHRQYIIYIIYIKTNVYSLYISFIAFHFWTLNFTFYLFLSYNRFLYCLYWNCSQLLTSAIDSITGVTSKWNEWNLFSLIISYSIVLFSFICILKISNKNLIKKICILLYYGVFRWPMVCWGALIIRCKCYVVFKCIKSVFHWISACWEALKAMFSGEWLFFSWGAGVFRYISMSSGVFNLKRCGQTMSDQPNQMMLEMHRNLRRHI